MQTIYGSRLLVLAGLLTVVCVDVPAYGEVNPFIDIITTRNVFGLKGPPPAPPPTETKSTPPKIILIGIANVLGVKKAVLKPQASPGTPAKAPVLGQLPPGQESSLILTEGAMQDGIAVLSIDELTGTVTVDNNGQELTLTFEKDGMKVPSGPATPALGVSSQPNLAGQPSIPRPPGVSGMVGAVGVNAFQPGSIPAVPSVTSGIGTAGGIASASLPQREVRGQARALTAVEAFVLTEVNRERNDALIRAGVLPRMPPPLGSLQPNVGR